jgi:FixJ family two-component response regulator
MSADAFPAYQPVVHIIDDDGGVRDGLSNLARSAGFSTKCFASPAHFIESWQPTDRGCVLLDIWFPDESGLDFQSQLQQLEMPLPIILITGQPDVLSSVKGMKAGALDFLVKPFDDQMVLNAIRNALASDKDRFSEEAKLSLLSDRYTSLTSREKEVFALVTKGLMNKQIAGALDLSEITVKVHRGTMMRKMNVRTLADLVRVAETLKTIS